MRNAGEACNARLEVLQGFEGLVGKLGRSGRSSELFLHLDQLAVDGKQGFFSLVLRQLLVNGGDRGHQRFDAVDQGVGLGVVADLGQLGQCRGRLGRLVQSFAVVGKLAESG